MLSVEEAFEAFEHMSAENHGQDRRHRWVSTGLWRVENAAKATMLAVLASVEMYIIDNTVVEGARAKIKALGK